MLKEAAISHVHIYSWHGTLPAKVEAKHRTSHQLLGNHILKDWCNIVHSNGRPSHPEDPVKLGSNEREPRLLGCLSKELFLHSQFCNLLWCECVYTCMHIHFMWVTYTCTCTCVWACPYKSYTLYMFRVYMYIAIEYICRSKKCRMKWLDHDWFMDPCQSSYQTHSNCVLTDETAETTRPITNGESSAIFCVGARLGAVIPMMCHWVCTVIWIKKYVCAHAGFHIGVFIN